MLLYQQMTEVLEIEEELAFDALNKDFQNTGEKGKLENILNPQNKQGKSGVRNKRQIQH